MALSANPLITGIILAGGRGRRLGGQDKGLIETRGGTLVEGLLGELAPQVDELLVNANRNIPRYVQFGYPVHGDIMPGYAGPLAGMLTALVHARHEWVVCVPCDTPALPQDYVPRMWEALARGGGRAVYAHDGRRAHPVYVLLHRHCSAGLQRYLAGGARRVEDWLRGVGAVPAAFPELHDGIANINEPADLAVLARQG